MFFSRRDFLRGALAVAGALSVQGGMPMKAAAEAKSIFPTHEPLGKGQGINPGRVVWMHEPGVVSWNGLDFWWKPENFDAARLLGMIRGGIMRLTGESSPENAWKALFEWRNRSNGKNGAYRPGQKIAVKVNMNGAGENDDDPHGQLGVSYGNAVLLEQLLHSLVRDGGVAPADVVVFDTCRIFPDYMRKICSSGELAGVRFSYRDQSGKEDSRADKNARINWAGKVKGEATYFPECVTKAAYLINLGNLKGHSWGLTLTAKNHFGTFINSERRTTPAAAGLHSNIIYAKMGDYSVLADLIAQKEIAEKTILWMLDALITAPSETVIISPGNAVWEMAPFNGQYACSLFFSQDPVAIDSVGADFLVNEPVMQRNNSNMRNKPEMENYLHEAALLKNPPSGTKYSGKAESLGVHEHWNNSTDKLYSRNLGRNEGIELIRN